MGPAARPSAGGQGFTLASPRPGGGPPSGRPTSELLGSATFQTPEGESASQSIIGSFVCLFSSGFGTFLSLIYHRLTVIVFVIIRSHDISGKRLTTVVAA
jgi:hypothetical protein